MKIEILPIDPKSKFDFLVELNKSYIKSKNIAFKDGNYSIVSPELSEMCIESIKRLSNIDEVFYYTRSKVFSYNGDILYCATYNISNDIFDRLVKTGEVFVFNQLFENMLVGYHIKSPDALSKIRDYRINKLLD